MKKFEQLNGNISVDDSGIHKVFRADGQWWLTLPDGLFYETDVEIILFLRGLT